MQADKGSSSRLRANRAWQDAELATYNTKSWFWWANSQQRAVVGKAKEKERVAAEAARQLNKQHDKLLSDAKAQLGLWSEVSSHAYNTLCSTWLKVQPALATSL